MVTRRTQTGSKGLRITVYGGVAGPDDKTGEIGGTTGSSIWTASY